MSENTYQAETTAPATTEVGVVDKLGLKTEVFIAQLVNFLIILIVLWKWGYKPLLRLMEDRQKRITKGLADAEAAVKVVTQADGLYAKKLKEARNEAAKMMQESEKRGESKREEMLGKAREEIAKLVTDARAKIVDERELAKVELKKEIAALVVTTAEMVLREKINPEKESALMGKTVKHAPKKK